MRNQTNSKQPQTCRIHINRESSSSRSGDPAFAFALLLLCFCFAFALLFLSFCFAFHPMWAPRALEENCRQTNRKFVWVTTRHGCRVGTTGIFWSAQKQAWAGSPFFGLLFFGESTKLQESNFARRSWPKGKSHAWPLWKKVTRQQAKKCRFDWKCWALLPNLRYPKIKPIVFSDINAWLLHYFFAFDRGFPIHRH